MWTKMRSAAATLIALLLFAVAAYGQAGPEVTLQGSLICNGACIPNPKAEDHVIVLYAIDGTAEVRKQLDRIMADSYPDMGLDAAAAEKVMDQFNARLKYYLAPESPALRDSKNKGPSHYCMAATASAVTGNGPGETMRVCWGKGVPPRAGLLRGRAKWVFYWVCWFF